ncbi:Lrp/AsnC family transcriptional regulator [Variovorax sp. PCZ-1]|uniref:Lrp/AsnC family transcriptional regulator n=1 Tax=Variovorax sp. PCZ-1 TaxID=2835533 RepID=UPI001BCC86E7|nr:Lrp/AsnC family transcriptional regulator [Variovorax sp. PCZ-1]MBS7806195.1 Lrp/AsnC family transcriptional regulator [Variovorax sp. PCZ-1]
MNLEFNSPLELDEIDIRLLQSLQNDASLSNQDLAAKVHVSPPTCLRRVKRMHDLGLIERQVAVLNADRLKPLIGAGLTAIVEVTLIEQTEEVLAAFESRMLPEPEVQQCYRVSPGPDVVIIVQVKDMPAYLELAQRLFTQDAKVRNVKAFFSVKRAKFSTELAWI